ncbi:MAG: YIP1 family protein [Promethearchaeota archaeon]
MRRPERRWQGRLSLRQRLWSTLTVPSVAFWDIAREPDRAGAFLILLGNVFSISLFYLLIILKVTGATSLIYGFLAVFPISTLFLIIYNLVFYGIIHMIIRLSGRKASFGDTFILGQYSALPLLLANLLSLGVLFVLLPAVSASELSRLVYPYQPIWLVVLVLTSIASLWGAVLLTLGIRERYHMSTSSALLTTFTVTIIVVLLGVFARLVPIT